MKSILLTTLFLSLSTLLYGQQDPAITTKSQKGGFYFYWGWNRGGYSKSDISFKGQNYDFVLKNVQAKDRQSKFTFGEYLNPKTITIPQYNYRVGYYFKENWDVSVGMDHMKYVVKNNQSVKISGVINNSNTPYDGTYLEDDLIIREDFLTFEHTDGLNYLNLEFRHSDTFISFKKISINHLEGLGLGILIPKTNTKLLNKERYDEFHISGYGLNAVLGLNVIFFDHLFIQSEFKTGYFELPNIRTTSSTADKASQNFFFTQLNLVFGYRFNLN